jgi:hypothetical protein
MPYDDFHRLDDNRRLGRFWLREEIPIPATKVIPANSEIPWLPYDQPHMAMGRYRDAPITYRTNAHGWRSREIVPQSPDRKIMFIGCSFTMGVGLPYEDIWTSVATRQIAAALGEPIEQHNFGYAAHGNDFFAMVVHQVLPILEPDLLVVLFTHFARRTHFPEFGRFWPFLPNWVVPGHAAEHECYVRLQSDANDFMNFVQQHSLIDATAALNGVPWIWQCYGQQAVPPRDRLAPYVRTDNMIDIAFPAYGLATTDRTMRWDLARDGKHPGHLSNDIFGAAAARHALHRGLLAPRGR